MPEGSWREKTKALEKKRKNAELVRKHRTILTSWSEDDRYADDKFHQKKLTECHDRYSRFRNALKLPPR
ncbi:MAG TPA: hypothetical protein HA252_05425 [Candidatus Diapherotrites archaeon]|uniref:Uncharacterized protein n=1 Tax=Candidatus Iainarchaeum sp. TaxID=3101447 RepID=A0A7J4JJN4_9ARCH|nr:hypothetical protein [Candidatus Diapherotrites archaeon]HIH16819.1 hypothetical protein [Candidatus Diapherotrites archaeon]